MNNDIVPYEKFKELLGAKSAVDLAIKAKQLKIPFQVSAHSTPRPFTTIRAIELSNQDCAFLRHQQPCLRRGDC